LTFITPKGLTLLDNMRDEFDSINRALADRLTEAEARQLAQLAEKVYSISE